MSCQHSQPGSSISCSACQLQALQTQNNQSWQSYAPTLNSQLVGVSGNRTPGLASAAAMRNQPLTPTLDETIDSTLESLILMAQIEIVKAYTDLVYEAGNNLNMSREEFIRLKFIDNKTEEQIQELIKDRLMRIIKLKGML